MAIIKSLILTMIVSAMLISCKDYTKPKYYHGFESGIHKEKGVFRKLRYRIFKPEQIGDIDKYPLILYLHHGGQKGKDNVKQVDEIAEYWTQESIQSIQKCFVLAPQCPHKYQWVNTGMKGIHDGYYCQKEIPEGVELKLIVRLIHKLIDEYPVDPNRIYLVGMSMGGSGSWDILCRYPNLFAAAIIGSGESDPAEAFRITNTHVWAFNGENDWVDKEGNANMVSRVNGSGGKAKHTILRNTDHDCFIQILNYPGILEWLFSR